MPFVEKTVQSRQGKIVLWDSEGDGLPLLLLHGTGASKNVFIRQFDSPLARTRRLIAIDLPGHGRSENAAEPRDGYRLASLADDAFDVLDVLQISRAAVLGWSLGGHVAIEMLRLRPDMLGGVMLTGAPPTGHGPLAMLRAFHLRPEMLFSSKAKFSRSEAERFAQLCFGASSTPALVEGVLASDGRSRPVIYNELLRGDGIDQRHIVEATAIPIAILNGANEPIVRLRYLESLSYQRLWGGACQVIEGAGHAPFLERPEQFNAVLDRFLASVAGQGRADRRDVRLHA